MFLPLNFQQNGVRNLQQPPWEASAATAPPYPEQVLGCFISRTSTSTVLFLGNCSDHGFSRIPYFEGSLLLRRLILALPLARKEPSRLKAGFFNQVHNC